MQEYEQYPIITSVNYHNNYSHIPRPIAVPVPIPTSNYYYNSYPLSTSSFVDRVIVGSTLTIPNNVEQVTTTTTTPTTTTAQNNEEIPKQHTSTYFGTAQKR
jgi:hypothetical protein